MMQSFLIALLLLCVASTSAFTSPHPWGSRHASSHRYMFSTDDDTGKPAAVPTTDLVTPNAAPALATMDAPATTDGPRSVVRNMNTGELREVKWVDPAMAANTNPLQMSWWAYIAFGFPFVVLANDVFHFLPTDGPLGFLGRL